MHQLRYFILLFALLVITKAKAQTDTLAMLKYRADPKREFRGAWIATVVNIDWPQQGSTIDQQKQQLVNILDQHQRTNLNAVMFQVRPAADAFYGRGREPWSKWLMGKQGQAPAPFYDPLDFAIAEAHKRGIELHAWFNPYRATFDNKYSALSPDHITKKKPEWFFVYGGLKLFNPGIPEVREYIVQVVLDVVDNYDVDGIHMDDYFYPYAIAGQKINDAATFAQYGSNFSDIRDWRRDNVNQLIKMLSDSIHKHKPRVKFGISPFGIWANKSQNPEGSDTRGGDSYYELYADSRKWIKEGWLDYINPQIYWPFKYRLAAFENLVDWWSNNTYNRHLYIGQAAYRIGERGSLAMRQPAEMPNQIKYLRNNLRVQGSVFFSSQSLTDNKLGFTDSLRLNYYKHPALPPVMLWLDSIPPNIPRNLQVAKIPNTNKVQLKWDAPLPAKDNELVYGYVIYRFEGSEKIDISTPDHILHIQYDANPMYVDTTTQRGKTYLYVITALDRLKNESDRSPTMAVTVQ
jgi:uncharacterized lipoprotein YddW (UPF0748 family)